MKGGKEIPCNFSDIMQLLSIYLFQALRHLYVLAVEPRLLIPRDIDCGNLCYAHITVLYLNGDQFTSKAPCLLPELELLQEVREIKDQCFNSSFK